MERVLSVTVVLPNEKRKASTYIKELRMLVESAGGEVVGEVVFELREINPASYLTRGKLAKLKELIDNIPVDLVVFGINLKASQQRNIEDVLGVRTIDYTQLILDIFARHAHSLEGKMQVELAQLEYLLPRLTGKGIMLSRLGGGIGTRGPGETKLEVDRRRIAQRINKLKRELERYRAHRERIRSSRKRVGLPTVSLIGYTSAGKSTLLNALTLADQKVSDDLFTTLDPLARRIYLSDGRIAILSDTVGFIDKLPHNLVEAFKATLEEVVFSDALILVIDGSDEDWDRKRRAVFQVLDEIGIGNNKPILTAINKIDIAPKFLLDEIEKVGPNPVRISALKGKGLEDLMAKLTDLLEPVLPYREEFFPYDQVTRLARIRKEGKIIGEEYREDGVIVKGYWK